MIMNSYVFIKITRMEVTGAWKNKLFTFFWYRKRSGAYICTIHTRKSKLLVLLYIKIMILQGRISQELNETAAKFKSCVT